MTYSQVQDIWIWASRWGRGQCSAYHMVHNLCGMIPVDALRRDFFTHVAELFWTWATVALLLTHWPPRPLLSGSTPTELKTASPEYSVPSLLHGPQNSGPSTIHSKVWVVLSNWPVLPLPVHCYEQISYFFIFPTDNSPSWRIFLVQRGYFHISPTEQIRTPTCVWILIKLDTR